MFNFRPALKCRHFELFWHIQCSFNLTSDIERSSQFMQEKYFHGDDVIDDVTGRPRNRPSIFPYKWKITFFRNNRDIIITPSVCMYHWILNMRIWLVMDYITDDVIRATNKSKLWTAIALSIFELEKQSKCMKLDWISEIRFSFTYRSANFGKYAISDCPFMLCVVLIPDFEYNLSYLILSYLMIFHLIHYYWCISSNHDMFPLTLL